LQDEIAALGPDPLREGVDARRLAEVLGARPGPIVLALMDQRVVAGLGIVQATEALFRARVNPARRSSSLSLDELRAVAHGIETSIAHTLAAIRDEDVFYLPMERGRSPFLVHDRLGGNCPRCDTEIGSVTEAGQTAAYCPSCQPAK
jgi:formamidopyrimidine-DNA glycosylase